MEINIPEHKTDKKKIAEGFFKTSKFACKIFGIILCYEPLSIKEIQSHYQRLWKVPLNRGFLSETLQKFEMFELIKRERAEEVIDSKNDSMAHSKIKKKQAEFLDTLPSNLRNVGQIRNRYYFYLTDFGKQYSDLAQDKGGYKLK